MSALYDRPPCKTKVLIFKNENSSITYKERGLILTKVAQQFSF